VEKKVRTSPETKKKKISRPTMRGRWGHGSFDLGARRDMDRCHWRRRSCYWQKGCGCGGKFRNPPMIRKKVFHSNEDEQPEIGLHLKGKERG